MTRIFNSTATAITYDSAGRVVGTQAYADADLSDPTTAHMVALGHLQLEQPVEETESSEETEKPGEVSAPSITVTPVTALATAEVALEEATKALTEH